MKNDVISYVFISMMLFTGLGFGSINIYDYTEPGDELLIFANVNSEQKSDDVSLRAVFYDFNDQVTSPQFDIDREGTQSVHMIYDIPRNAPKGEYVVRFIAENDDESISKYRFFIVD